MDYHKLRYEAVLIKDDYSSVQAYIIQLRNPPPIMCSSGFAPAIDFDGNELQDLTDLSLKPDMLTVSSYFSGQYGYVVFTWLNDDYETCARFINSLEKIKDDRLSSALVQLMFNYFENIHIAPEWWDGLDNKYKDFLVNTMTNSGNPFVIQKKNPLADNGMRIEPWEVESKYWVK
ncbi:MAG TPA: hypothetical protein VK954_09005 [Methyloradius sp.]|nr:hypothetical protein [Methyloradius sp.]